MKDKSFILRFCGSPCRSGVLLGKPNRHKSQIRRGTVINMDEYIMRQIDGGELSARIAQNGRELLRYEIIYPRIKAGTLQENRVNRYHLAQAKAFERLIKSKYLPDARRQFKWLAPENAFAPLEISASYQVMLNSNRLLSLFTDTYAQLRHGGSRLSRSSKTYDMDTGRQLRLGELFQRGALVKDAILAAIEPQIALEDERNPGMYFADWREILAINMTHEGYYLTDGGIVIYFQQEKIANANAGLPSFLVPYPVLQPVLRYEL